MTNPTDQHEPPPGEDDPAFLSAVAAESIRDAIVLLTGLRSKAEPHLQRALAILLDCTAFKNLPAPGEGSSDCRPALSARAIDLLVEQRHREMTALDSGHREPRCPPSGVAPSAARQRAIIHMLEALSLLDESEDSGTARALQRALDQALGPNSEAPDPAENPAARRPPS